MDRMACVNLPAFPLQLLIQRHPDWKRYPVAVVDKDKPQGVILWVNKRAARASILPGMRYAKGLSLAPDLRAGEVSGTEVQNHIDALTERLRFFTPDVEPSYHEPGVFWLNASGLSLLYPSMRKWGGLIVSELTGEGFYCSAAAGFTRYGTYAAARTSQKITVFENPDEERSHVRALPIVRLGFPPELRDALAQLAITTLGDFIGLPEDGIRKRFGDEAYDLYKMARGELFAPIESKAPEAPLLEQLTLEHPESQVERLMLRIEEMLEKILTAMQERNERLTTVTISLILDNGAEHHETLQPAASTVEKKQILTLIALRLHSRSLVSGVVEITVDAQGARANQKQLELFDKKPRRDLAAAERAFALLRAEFGDRAVMRARLREGHLPEACYEWEPMDKLSTPAPRKVNVGHLARRIFDRSISFFSWARRQGGSLRMLREADNPRSGADAVGPYIVSGGWWRRRVHREYYFVRSPQGRWLWIYYDKRRKQAFVQGAVE